MMKTRFGTSLLGAGLLLGLLQMTTSGLIAEEPTQPEAIDALSQVVSGELTDVADALRRLDQSYVYRGFQGCGAATAGSVHVDWEAKGIPPEQRARVLPPQPLVLSRSLKQPCESRQVGAPVKTAPIDPVPGPQAGPAPAPQAPPCPQCAGAETVVTGPDCPCQHGTAASPHTGDAFAQPAEIYYHGQCVNGGCGGRVPPNVMVWNGRPTELPSRGCGQTGFQHTSPGVRLAPATTGSGGVW